MPLVLPLITSVSPFVNLSWPGSVAIFFNWADRKSQKWQRIGAQNVLCMLHTSCIGRNSICSLYSFVPSEQVQYCSFLPYFSGNIRSTNTYKYWDALLITQRIACKVIIMVKVDHGFWKPAGFRLRVKRVRVTVSTFGHRDHTVTRTGGVTGSTVLPTVQRRLRVQQRQQRQRRVL